MAGNTEQECAKSALLVALSKTFSADYNERKQAEEKLTILETISEYGVFLSELIADKSIPLPTRQLAAVILGHYVSSHWSSHSEKFVPPEVDGAAKASIRKIMSQGLVDESSKIRLSVAHVLSHIIHWDWPEEWPDIFSILIQFLNSGNVNAVHGAMRVLAEFVGDISDLQIPHLAPVILPELLNIFVQDKLFSVRTRSRAVQIYSTISGLIGVMKEVYKTAPKNYLYPSMPNFVQAFTLQLSAPYGETSDCGLKMEILEAFTTLLKGFPKFMATYLPTLLPPVWEVFTSNVEEYSHVVVNAFQEKEEVVDEDGELLNFENLIFAVFELITALVEIRRFQNVVAGHLEAILLHTMIYMQMTEEQIISWASDPSQFVEDEDEETFSYSIRISAQSLIQSLCDKFSNNGIKGLLSAVTSLTNQATEARAAKNSKWWKLSEVCFLCLGYVHDTMMVFADQGKLEFDIRGYLSGHGLDVCRSAADYPFLSGQALWCASKYVPLLTDEPVDEYLSLSILALHNTSQPVLQVYAIKSLYGFCEHLREKKPPLLIQKHIPGILSGLASVAGSFTGNALTIGLETLTMACKVDPSLTATHSQSCNLIQMVLVLFMRHGTDPFLSDILIDLAGSLAEIPACAESMIRDFVPAILQIITSANENATLSLVPSCLDVLTSITRHCPKPLPDAYIQKTLPVVTGCVLQSDDNAIIQNGGETVRALFSCAAESVIAWQDGSGNDGLSYVVRVLAFLLDPRSSEFTASFAGKLIFVLVSKASGRLGDNLPLILRAVLSKLQQCNTMTVSQALLMVFIQLLRHEMQSTLEFLSSVPGPMGQSAFDYILTQWCAKQPTFFGSYDIRVSCITMKDLLIHAVRTDDKRFQQLVVPGDEIDSGQAGPASWTQIPVAIKLLKLVLNELRNQMEDKEGDPGSEDDDYEDDDDEYIDDSLQQQSSSDKQSVSNSLLAPASDYNGYDFYGEEDDEEGCEDPDQNEDPINGINLKFLREHSIFERYANKRNCDLIMIDKRDELSGFVREFSQHSYFPMFVEHFTSFEKDTLTHMGIATN